MKTATSRVISILAVGLGLVACGGSDDDGFQYPGATGSSLPYEVIGKVANAQGTELRNGSYGSSLAPHPSRPGYFYGLSDRGPNAATEAGRTPSGIIFLAPSYTPRIGLFRLTSEGKTELAETILLKDPKGRAITGLPNKNFGGTGETPYNLDGSVVTLDPDGDGIAGFDESGLDSEGLVALKDGTFWISDEYGPHIVHFDATGKEIERINPFAADPRNRAGRVLPAELSKRWPNRGMEGLTITPDGKTLVGIMQSNLYNPSSAVGSINLTRIVTVNIDTGATAQYLYRQDAAGLANSEIVALSATSFLVIERDTKFFGIDTGTVRKNVYKVDLARATNVDASNASLRNGQAALTVNAATGLLVNGKTLEQVIKDAGNADNFAAGWAQLSALGIQPAAKTLAYDGIATQKYPHDKMEGLWVIDANRLGILNDADFMIAPDGAGGVKQKLLNDGKVENNMLYVVKPIAPLF
ncbi:MAG: esterase-like activity of phytase family protein [Giesbergeria sp.]|jgi:hypothetical protein|nr:esterase-like activity of phytase family protein [Giesbergeria sp.]